MEEELEKIVGEEISEERLQMLYDITEFLEGRSDSYEVKNYTVREDRKESTKHNLILSKNYKLYRD